MNYEGMIITARDAQVRRDLAEEFCRRYSNKFVYIPIVTTESSRADDYLKVPSTQWSNLRLYHKAVHVDSSKEFGIATQHISSASNRNLTPVFTLAPEDATALDNWIELQRAGNVTLPKFMTIYIESTDTQFEEERKTFMYSIQEYKSPLFYELIYSLWMNASNSGVLSWRIIQLMTSCGMLLKDCDTQRIQGASYDLRLGSPYYYGGQVEKLSDDAPFLIIKPYDYAIVTSFEQLRLPIDVCARIDLTVSLFCQGVIVSTGPQVDPGFDGPISCLLFNTSSSEVRIDYKSSYATIVFDKLIEPTYPYKGRYKGAVFIDYLPQKITMGAINTLKQELEDMRQSGQALQATVLTIFGLILALIAIWVTLVPSIR